MERKERLFVNTVMLYILTFSNYLLNFILVPYETRVLGAEKYGLIGLATAIMVYFQLFIDFGFLLSATEEVAKYRDDKKRLSVIFTSVTACKGILTAISVLVLSVLCMIIPRWSEHSFFLMIFCLSAAVGALLPDYLYRGIEKMSVITVRTVLIKLLFVVLVFVFVKKPQDYVLIPIFQLSSNLLALFGVYTHIFYKLKVTFTQIKLIDVMMRMKTSSLFFFSRIASTAYTAANTIVIDFISAGTMTAFYTSADKLVNTAKSGLAPISDSLYPYMVKSKDFKLVKKVLLVIEPLVIAGCVILFVWATPICEWFFGVEYSETANILRALLPSVVVILPSYIFGFPVLGAMGLNKYANYSVIAGAVFHVMALIVLFLTGCLNMMMLGVVTSVTECLVLAFRVFVVISYHRRMGDARC